MRDAQMKAVIGRKLMKGIIERMNEDLLPFSA